MARKKATRRVPRPSGARSSRPSRRSRAAVAAGPKQVARRAPKGLSFTRTNGILLGCGLLALAMGYWLLSRGDITAAPLLLVLGYVVLLPLAIIR